MNENKTNRRNLRIIIIGAGMAGILAATRLRRTGHTQVALYEKGDRIGGTWRDNTYPGLNCDVPAHAYTYSFAPNPDWSSYLAGGPEILAYFESVVKNQGIKPWIHFNQEVTSCIFRDGRWHVTTASGLTDTADIIVAATGVLHHPNYPTIDGLESFAGAKFHSARWDHAIPLDGRRIGVVGNGSTGVQIVSALVDRAAKVVHFQRSPQWIMPVKNEPYTVDQIAAFRNDPALVDRERYSETYMANVRLFTDAIIDAESPQMIGIETVVRDHLENSVSDPVLRENLRPSYRAACKRLIYSPDYYAAIQHPSAELVVQPIRKIEPQGVRTTDGALHEIDVLVLATGFRADRFVRPMTVLGRAGADLNDVWKRRPKAYMAISIPKFPNFFLLNGPTGPVGNFSLIDIAERQWGYIEQLIAQIECGNCREISVTEQAMGDYDERRIAAAKKTIFASGCSSWYLDAEGVPTTWPWSYDRFAEEMAHPRLDAFEALG
jgi:cation diffusion facilitator CzcD-associated flavoprotein CzcO